MAFEENITPQFGIRRDRVNPRQEAVPGTTLLEEFGDGTGVPVRSVHGRATDLLARTKQQCQDMLAQTAHDCRDIRETARKKGFEEGRREGLDAADQEAAGLIAMCENIALSVAQERDHTLAQAEGDLVKLAIQLSEKIIGAAIETDERLVLEALRGALRRAYNRSEVTVLAHPEDLALLRQEGSAIAEALGGIDSISFVSERRIDRGGVIVRTPTGEIDGTPEGKLDRLGDRLRELVSVRLNQDVS